jgi:hypothetical protein
MIILSSEELEILEYLKSWNGQYVALAEICRRAGGRQRYKETPNWAKPLMSRLVEARMAEVNERGHYRFLKLEENAPEAGAPVPVATGQAERKRARWISPHIASILKKSGKGFGEEAAGA